MNSFFRRYGDLSLTFLLVALFLVLAFPHLQEPGPYYDEVYDAGIVVDRFFSELPQIPLSTFSFLGLRIPWSTNGFTGVLKTYLLIPVFLIFGPSVFAMRLTMLFAGVVNVALTYSLARLFLRRFPALLSLLLLILDPNFVFETRMDWGPSVLSYFFRVAGCFYLIRGWGGKKRVKIVLSFFLFLLGIYNKITFHLFLLPFCVTLLLFFWNDIRREFKEQTFPGGILLFFFIMASVITLGYFFRLPFDTFPHRSILQRGTLFFQFLKGRLMIRQVLGMKTAEGIGETFFFPLFLLTFLATWGYPFSAGVQKSFKREKGFLTLLVLLMLFLLFLVPGVRYGCHFFLLYPLPHLTAGFLIQAFLAEASSQGSRKRLAVCILSIYLTFVFIAAGSGILVIQKSIRLFAQTGGRGFWSDAIYDLGEYLTKQGKREVVCLDWGFQRNLLVVTKGKIRFLEPFWPWIIEGKDPKGDLQKLFSEPGKVFLLHEEPFTKLVKVSQIQAWARETGYDLRMTKTFYQKTGEAVFSVYVASPHVSSH